MRKLLCPDSRGSTAVPVLLVLSLVMVFGFIIIQYSGTVLRGAESDRMVNMAWNAAHVGIERALYEIGQEEDCDLDASEVEGASTGEVCPQSEVEEVIIEIEQLEENEENNGDNEEDNGEEAEESCLVTITSTGVSGRVNRTVTREVVLPVDPEELPGPEELAYVILRDPPIKEGGEGLYFRALDKCGNPVTGVEIKEREGNKLEDLNIGEGAQEPISYEYSQSTEATIPGYITLTYEELTYDHAAQKGADGIVIFKDTMGRVALPAYIEVNSEGKITKAETRLELSGEPCEGGIARLVDFEELPGKDKYEYTVTAEPSENYEFDRWEEDGEEVSQEDEYEFDEGDHDELVAIFVEED